MRKAKWFTFLMVVVCWFLLTGDLPAKVVKMTVTVTPTTFTGKCPHEFVFTGVIVSDAPGAVKYKWIRSDGALAPEQTIMFTGRGKQTVTTTWTLGAEGTHWEAIEIIEPNHMVSNKAPFKLKCRMLAVVEPGVRIPCIDPAAEEVRFDITRRISQFTGDIRITGVVKNIGNKDFQSGSGQAKAYLFMTPQGGKEQIVAQQEITNLPVGAVINLVYNRSWNSSSPNEGEFPPVFSVEIRYDPDIYMDNNDNNNDCNQNNNRKVRNGSEINDMLR